MAFFTLFLAFLLLLMRPPRYGAAPAMTELAAD
jgi:hypothetical protein